MTTIEHAATSDNPTGAVASTGAGPHVEAARILVAVDGTEASANVAAPPVPPGAAGSVVTTWYPWPALPPVDAPAYEDVVRGASEGAERTAREAGVADAEPLSALGSPADAILRLAEERDVHLIVVGSHHRGWLERLLSPPVSEQLVRRASCAVLVVP